MTTPAITRAIARASSGLGTLLLVAAFGAIIPSGSGIVPIPLAVIMILGLVEGEPWGAKGWLFFGLAWGAVAIVLAGHVPPSPRPRAVLTLIGLTIMSGFWLWFMRAEKFHPVLLLFNSPFLILAAVKTIECLVAFRRRPEPAD